MATSACGGVSTRQAGWIIVMCKATPSLGYEDYLCLSL